MHDFTRTASQRRKGLLRSRTVTFCVLLTATSPAWAGDTHFTAMTDTIMNMIPYGGFDGVNPANGPDSRLIYDRAGTAQSIAATARSIGQLVFLAPYTGSGFVTHAQSLFQGVMTLHGIDGLGVDSRVDHQINLTDKIALGNSQEWRVESTSGRVSQLTNAASGRGINLNAFNLTLNAVNAGNSFSFANPISGTGGLVITGKGTTYLSGVNTYSGGTFLNAGTLSVAADDNLGNVAGDLIFDGGTLQLSGSFATARTMTLNAGGGTVDTQDNAVGLSGDISGTGGLTKTGGGALTLTGDISYTGATTVHQGTLALSGGASIAQSSHVVADGTLDFSGVSGGSASINNLSGSGAVVLGGTALTIANANSEFSGTVSGTGALHITGVKQALSGNSAAFAGTTTVKAATLAVTGTLGGTLDVLADGRLQGTGVVGATTNAGVIAPGNSIGTLTIASDYVGNGGSLEIEAVLGGDNSSADRLVVTGSTSGTTNLTVINLGGAGEQTIEGIKIIEIDGTSNGTFQLNGNYIFKGQQAVIAGAYAYVLQKNGIDNPTDGDWYLRSSYIALASDPSTPIDTSVPPAGPVVVVPIYQPDVPVYEVYSQTMLALNSLPTLQQRVGNRQWAPGRHRRGKGIWGWIEGERHRGHAARSSSLVNNDIDSWKMQIGVDRVLHQGGNGNTLVAGITARYGHARADVGSVFGNGYIKTDGYGVGATLTWYSPDGFYADAQAQFSWFNSDLNSVSASLAKDNDGKGKAFSIELGKRSAIGGKLTLTPQIQFTWSDVDFDSFVDPNGLSVSNDYGKSLGGRAGLSLDHQSSWQDRSGNGRRSHIYGLVNLSYAYLDGTRTNVADARLIHMEERLWGGIGLGGSYSWAGDRFMLFAEATANTALRDFGESYSLKGSGGFRMKF
ncbi:MAG TPA: autotransporter outer membrane beta-barrel domain-containing protein [Sphingobium sp.]|nr:autotransporter outer membrane beta-barrel domain-containing protein [Sphingobium sp.]